MTALSHLSQGFVIIIQNNCFNLSTFKQNLNKLQQLIDSDSPNYLTMLVPQSLNSSKFGIFTLFSDFVILVWLDV